MLAALALATACSTSQTLHIRSSEPAQIWLYGKKICATTPCEYHYQPEGCGWPRLMASNQFVLEAHTDDGRVARACVVSHCEVPDEWSIAIPRAEER